MRNNRLFGWLFSDCHGCDVLFWIVLGGLAGGLAMLLLCAAWLL